MYTSGNEAATAKDKVPPLDWSPPAQAESEHNPNIPLATDGYWAMSEQLVQSVVTACTLAGTKAAEAYETARPQLEAGAAFAAEKTAEGIAMAVGAYEAAKPTIEAGIETAGTKATEAYEAAVPTIEAGMDTVRPQLEAGSAFAAEKTAEGIAMAVGAYEAAKPTIEAGIETAGTKATEAYEATVPTIEAGMDTVRPQLEAGSAFAAEKTAEGIAMAVGAYEAAVPTIEAGIETASTKANEAYETARPQLEAGAALAAEKTGYMAEQAHVGIALAAERYDAVCSPPPLSKMVLQDEASKPLDASDVQTARGESAVAEVRRLRQLLHAASGLPKQTDAAQAEESTVVEGEQGSVEDQEEANELAQHLELATTRKEADNDKV